MFECPNCFKEVKENYNTCNYCSYHLPKNKKLRTKPLDLRESKGTKVFNKDIVSTKDWLFLFLLLCIPVLNLFLLYSYGIKDKVESSKRNFCRAIIFLILLYAGFGILGIIINFIKGFVN